MCNENLFAWFNVKKQTEKRNYYIVKRILDFIKYVQWINSYVTVSLILT